MDLSRRAFLRGSAAATTVATFNIVPARVLGQKIAERTKEKFRAAGSDLIDIDGVRVKFSDGWGLIRASNTQPILVMRFEATNAAKLAEYRSTVEKVVDEVKREVGAG